MVSVSLVYLLDFKWTTILHYPSTVPHDKEDNVLNNRANELPIRCYFNMSLFIPLHKYILPTFSIWLLPDRVEDPELEWLEAKYTWPLSSTGFRSANIYPSSAVKKQYMTFGSSKAKLSLGVCGGNWFQTFHKYKICRCSNPLHIMV